MAEVINLSDAMNPPENLHISEEQPVTENIDLGEISGEDFTNMIQMMSGGDLDNFSEEDKKKLGITDEDIAKMKIQMQQYQEQAKAKQAYAILGQVFQIIQEKYPEDDILPSETNKIEIYEELNEHLLQTVTNIMDTRMNEIYDEMAETVKNILIKEKTEPFMKYEDRIESKFGPSNKSVYDIVIPGTTFRSFNNSLAQSLQQRSIDENLVSYRILEFIINSVVMKTAMLDDNMRKDILDSMSNIPKFLDSIAVGKISNYVIDDVVKGVKEEFKDYAIAVIDEIFPAIS